MPQGRRATRTDARGTRWVAPVPVVAALGLVTASFTLTAGNTVPTTKAGDGQGVISGYAAASVHYGLNSTDPSTIDVLTFTLDSTPPAGSVIRARLTGSGGSWYACTNSGANVTCDTTVGTAATVATADLLRVVVSQ